MLHYGIPYLVKEKLGDTSIWEIARRHEAETLTRVQLRAQLNLYILKRNPFCDETMEMTDITTYWNSKLHLENAKDLAKVNLFDC